MKNLFVKQETAPYSHINLVCLNLHSLVRKQDNFEGISIRVVIPVVITFTKLGDVSFFLAPSVGLVRQTGSYQLNEANNCYCAGIRTRGYWLRSANPTSVPCRHPIIPYASQYHGLLNSVCLYGDHRVNFCPCGVKLKGLFKQNSEFFSRVRFDQD